jgi:hypothetical protein
MDVRRFGFFPLIWSRSNPAVGLLCSFLLVFSTGRAEAYGASSHPLLSALRFDQSAQPPQESKKPAKQETPTPAGSSESSVESVLEQALQEYRVQIDRVTSVEHQGQGGRTRSRMEDYHGNFYEYLRNDALDALPHEVRQANGGKSVLRRNQFGFNLTGPVRIPHVYDGRGRTFFSVTYEGTREKISRPNLNTIPTVQQRTGDFSDLVDDAGEPVKIYDALTTRPNPEFDPAQPVSLSNLQYLRDPFPGNIIPRDRLDPVALKAISYYPPPNTNVGPFLRNNFFSNSVETNTPNGTVWKLDQSLGTRHKLSWNGRLSSGLAGAAPLFENAANPGSPPRLVSSRSSGISETFNASPTVVNQFNVSAWHSALENEGSGGQTIDYAGELGLTGVQVGSFPRFEFSPYISIGSQLGSLIRYQTTNYSVSDGLSVRHKSHNFRIDLSAYWAQVNTLRPRDPAGRFLFDGKLTSLPGINNTGNGFAQFLLGFSDSADQSVTSNPSYFRIDQYQLTIGDQYQMTPDLNWSFSLGMQIDDSRREKYDQQSNLDLQEINPANERPGALIFAGRDGHPQTFSPRQVNWRPSVSGALNPWGNRKTVIRASYSLFFQGFPIYPTDFGTLGFNAYPLILSDNDQLTAAVVLRTGFPQNFVYPPDLRPTAANGSRANYMDPIGTLPYMQNWLLEVERDLPAQFVVRVGYHGEKGTHLFMGNGLDLNALSPEALAYGDRLYDLDFNSSLRPYPQYREIVTGYGYPIGSNTVHYGDFRVEKRFSHGLNFTAAYTLSKSIDNILDDWDKPQNSRDLMPEKSISPYDVTHRISVNSLYEFPFGPGKAFLNKGGWFDNAVGGWSISGVATLRSGIPIMLSPLFNNTGGVAEDLRVNVIPEVNPHVNNPSPDQWFNPAAFDQPADFTLGNGPRTDPSLRNPGARNIDMSLTKRMPLSEDWTLELIVEAFNTFNHANWNMPDPAIGSKENPNLNAGKIVGSSGGRVVQFGLRFSF